MAHFIVEGCESILPNYMIFNGNNVQQFNTFKIGLFIYRWKFAWANLSTSK